MVATTDRMIFNNWVLVLLKFIELAIPMYDNILSPYERFPEVANYSQKEAVDMLNDIMRWKEKDFNPDSLNTSSYDSFSLPFALCEIATKALDCVLHEEKIGAAFVLYRASIDAYQKIYDIEHAEEFIDIFIKILNSFDYILTSLSLMDSNVNQKYVLVQVVPALQITNRLFNNDTYREDPDSYHPETKTLISATLKLQQDLRKGLFEGMHGQEASLEFFMYKSKLDKRDEYVVDSYNRALDAAKVYALAKQFKLSATNIMESEEGEIASPSEFDNLYQMLEQLLSWVELWLDFPFEQCLLNLIEYAELMDLTSPDSPLEKVIKLFISYLKLPLEEIRTRILSKCIIRLQLREELLKQKDSKVMNKFLSKFLTRKQILDLVCKDLLLSSLSNIDGIPCKNSNTELLMKLACMLISSCDLEERRNMSTVLHSFQICSSTHEYARDSKYIIESVQDCLSYRAVKNICQLRDLFSIDSDKRELVTHLLNKKWEGFSAEDILRDTFELDTCAVDAMIELNVYASGVSNSSYIDYDKLYSLFLSDTSASIKQTAIQQLSVLIVNRSDNSGVSGRRLFREKKANADVFTLVIQDLLNLYQQCKERGVNSLHPNEINYVQELLRFFALSLLFYFDEAVVTQLVKPYFDLNDSEDSETTKIYFVIEALKCFLGCKKTDVRKNVLRCLQIILLKDQTKICIDQSSGMPYLSIPWYMSNYCVYLFTTKSYKFTVISKIPLLTQEEKQLIMIKTNPEPQQNYSAMMSRSGKKQSFTQSLFQLICTLNCSQTMEFFASNNFKEMLGGSRSMSMTAFTSDLSTHSQNSFEIIPSDLTSVQFLQSLRIVLKDLREKLSSIRNDSKISKGLSSFYLLITAKMKEINLPYHYIYSQIIEKGIENKVTSVTEPLKLSKEGAMLVEALRSMLEIIILLIETDKMLFNKFKITFNCMQELVRFENPQDKSLIDDLINLSIFLKEKGDPFKVLVLRLASMYLESTGNIKSQSNDRLLDKIGTFAIDIVSSVKLSDDFHTNYLVLLGMKILNIMIENHTFAVYDKVGKRGELEGISDTGMERIASYNTYGWLTRFINHRDSRIKAVVWHILTHLVSENLLDQHPSLIDSAFECFINETELYSIKMTSLSFLTVVIEYLMHNESTIDDEDDSQNEDRFTINMAYIIKCVNKHMLISKIEGMLYQENIPALYISTLIRFLKGLRSDFSNCLPLFTTLDIWNTLSQLLNPANIMQKYRTDNRSILYKGKNKRIMTDHLNEVFLTNAYVIDATSIISLVLESVKKDSSIAGVIVRSVPFLESMINWLVYVLNNDEKAGLESLLFTGLTLLQYLLAYSEEDTFKSLCKLFKLSPNKLLGNPHKNRGQEESIEAYDHIWPFLADMIDSSDKLEVHYIVIRLATSFIQCFDKYYDGNNGLSNKAKSDSSLTYGVLMWYKYCILFKRVYFPKKADRQDFSESFKNDISMCLSTLLLHSQESKVTAIKENLVQKLSEKANDLCNAYKMGLLQNMNNRSVDKDTRFFERECVRILKILKNAFYQAQESIDEELLCGPASTSCPKTIQNLVEIYRNSCDDTESTIFIEICEVLCTLVSQSNEIKKSFSVPMKNKKSAPIKYILKSLRMLNMQSKGNDVKLVLNLLTSLCVSAENVKMVIKDKVIEDVVKRLHPVIKTEKDILSRRVFLTWFAKFLASFTLTKEGAAAMVSHKSTFDLILFCLDELTAPSSKETDIVLQFFVNSLLFLGNSSAYRKNKQHVLLNKSIFTMLSSSDYPMKVKAFAAQAICMTLYDDQGIKAKWNPKIFSMLDDIKQSLVDNNCVDDANEDENALFADRHLAASHLVAHKKEGLTLEQTYRQICINALIKITDNS